MLTISRSERHTILALLIFGTLCLTFSYFQKTLPDIEKITIEEKRVLVNINTATAGELERLPGIGPVFATKIVSYREEIGGYSSTEELKDMKGIGDKKFEAIKDLVTINE